MDKFTVDLEKVLDEFEYSESRDETILPPINSLLTSSNQRWIATPASCYRRPAFEPIHLADADFSAAPIPPVNVKFSMQTAAALRETFNSNNKDTVGCTIQKDTPSHSMVDSYSPGNPYNGNVKKKVCNVNNLGSSSLDDESSSQISVDGVSSEGTPDLLDSTSPMRQSQSIHPIYDREWNQLPDITSVLNNVNYPAAIAKDQSAFDSRQSEPEWRNEADFTASSMDSFCSFEDEDPTAGYKTIQSDLSQKNQTVCTGNEEFSGRQMSTGEETSYYQPYQEPSSLASKLSDLKLQPLTFSTDDISDSELEEYLEHIADLGDEQPLLERAKSPDEASGSSSTSQLLSSDDAATLNQVTTESTEVETVDKTTVGSTDSSIEDSSALLEDNTNEFIQPLIADVPDANHSISSPPEETLTVVLEGNTSDEVGQEVLDELSNGHSAVGAVENEVAISEMTSTLVRQSTSETSVPYLPVTVFVPSRASADPAPVEDDVSTVITENETNENIENVEKSATLATASTVQESTPDVQTDQYPIEGIEEQVLSRPSSLSLTVPEATESEESPTPTNVPGFSGPLVGTDVRPGKTPPFWVPDADTEFCMHCQLKFTMIRRRHHCRACGLVLCSKCCCLKAPLEYMEYQEARVCQPCFTIIYMGDGQLQSQGPKQPNPNNPMEYCSTIPPLQQAASTMNQPPPSVLVPSGVLKREGRAKSDVPKQVIFSDGIRPGGDLTELDGPSEPRPLPKRTGRRFAGGGSRSSPTVAPRRINPETQSFIPSGPVDLPPVTRQENGQLVFLDDVPVIDDTPITYAINYNLFVHIKRVKLECCVNRECWSICSEGLAIVGQDEVALVLECVEGERLPPQDVFHFINTLYLESAKGSTISELSFTPAFSSTMFGSKNHGGFLYIRPTFQCTTNLLLPQQPYIIAILVHRWETPWARLFPLRLILRLGAEYRYYPCPLISIRNRDPLYTDIGHTVMKILVDFKKYSYSLATVRGLVIHMEDRQTTILYPRNRYDQVVKALNNSDESVLAFGANLSMQADSHLVCIQGTKDENTYHTQAINIHSKPRKVTGASFVVFNGALKVPGLSGKTSIVEDGLMVQLPSDNMAALRAALRDMKDFTISCGPNDEETVHLKWSSDDVNFNIGVKSVIDGQAFDGVPSIRVHNGTDYGADRIIRWTEVFILKSEEDTKAKDPLDISRVSDNVARATCLALLQDLESLVRAGIRCLAIRTNIHPDSVGYEAGANGSPLPQVHMNSLDEELVPVLHQAAISAQDSLILELVFRIIDHP
ncbi:Hypothetical proteinad anchor for receptor activation [Nesidiocoris tenuis]|uniref:FYVE-type domain-containing protein n=1 Tax=Nesidiocoris tenuis TaxID=355587 RepID=A0ABN7B304_9HEMI|nr:Hypothetical proteinad anchor for receptor activation [Nesidiocoris tenuis]